MLTRTMAAACLFCLLTAACAVGTVSRNDAAPAGPPHFPSNPPVAEDLTFTGMLSGHMSSGTAGDLYVCASTGGSFVAGPILGYAGSRQVEMNITKVPFTGAGTYSPGGVSFDSGSDHYYPAAGAPGSLVVAPDLRSGSLDISLAANTNPNAVVGQADGTWRCPPDS